MGVNKALLAADNMALEHRLKQHKVTLAEHAPIGPRRGAVVTCRQCCLKWTFVGEKCKRETWAPPPELPEPTEEQLIALRDKALRDLGY